MHHQKSGIIIFKSKCCLSIVYDSGTAIGLDIISNQKSEPL